MKLRYITCSDPRENLNPSDVVDLLKKFPMAELGVQTHYPQMGKKGDRFIWFNKILDIAKKSKTPIHLSMHVNFEWCDDICNGKMPDEIAYLLEQKHPLTDNPLVSRIQLNIGDQCGGIDTQRAQKLSKLISDFHNYEFILPFNYFVRDDISRLKSTGAKFNLLFDASYGAGVSPDHWDKPVFDDRQFGYAGGISPTNVTCVLSQIANILPKDYQTWIDAEGKLRNKQNYSMDLDLAQKYLTEASKWYNDYQK